MGASRVDSGRRRRAWRVVGALLALASLAAVVALAVVMVRSQDQARADAIERFDERGTVVARLLAGDLQQSISSAATDTGRVQSGDVTEQDHRDNERLGD